MAIKANKDATKGFFGKIFEALNPGDAVKNARRTWEGVYDARLSVVQNSMRDGVEQLKNTDLSDTAREKIQNKIKDSAMKNTQLKNKAENFKAGSGLSGNDILESTAVTGMSAFNYYNPFGGKDAKTMAARYGATAGAVSAGAIAKRYMQGGTLTKEKGRRKKDIAGVPFI